MAVKKPARIGLRPAASTLAPSKNSQQVKTVAAPTGGLNSRDPLSNMPATDAYELVNWIPQQFGIKLRKGFSEWRSSGSDEVKSIMNYFSGSTVVAQGSFSSTPITMPGKLFAATDVGIYDVTDSGVSAATLVQALSSNAEAGRFSYINFTNAAGTSYILAASEADGYFTYDGATWVKVTLGVGATQVSVVDPTTFVHVSFWKSRVWFVTRNSPKVCYLPAVSLYGAATVLDLGPLLKRGGGIAWISTWTIDAGEGIDDYIVFCSTNGEVLVYQGTDPASPATFALVGRWDVGQVPIGRRGYAQMGGDLLILSTMGISPLSFVTRGGAAFLTASQKEYTSKIAPLFNERMNETFNAYGWAMHVSQREGLLIVSSPVTNEATTQYVMNIANGAWTKFNDMDIRSMGSSGGWTLFGSTTGMVYLAFVGHLDAVSISTGLGVAIYAKVLPAFTPLEEPAQIKHFLLSRLTFLASNTPALISTMSTDFLTTLFSSRPTLVVPDDNAEWDVAVWDSDVWGGAQAPYEVLQNSPGVGYYASLGLGVSSDGELTLTNITYIFEGGGVI